MTIPTLATRPAAAPFDLDAVKRNASLRSLAGEAGVALKASAGELKGCCPFHPDKTPSFTIYDGETKWKCFGCGEGGDVLDFVRRWKGLDLPGAVLFLDPAAPTIEQASPRQANDAPATEHAVFLRGDQRIVATFEFFGADGDLLYRKHRVEPGLDKRKDFKFDHPNGDGGWLPGQGERRVPYRLTDLLTVTAPVVFMTEGEAKADRIASWGLLATSHKDWQPDFNPFLARRRVVVLPDNDESGESQAVRVVEVIAKGGLATAVLRIPGLPDKGDVLDWTGSARDLTALATRLFDANDEWPEPVDLWAHYSAPSLPEGLLPDVIERFARKHCEVMGADPAGLAMAALTVCATAISDDVSVQVKRNDPTWRESCRLWVGLVGPPSRKKTPILKAALRPLRRLDGNLMADYLAKVGQYEALPNDQRKAAPKPKQKRLLISDATIEAAQEVMKDSPDGIMSEQDELSGWFGAMDKYAPGKGAQADRAFWLKAFNGGVYNLNRIARGATQIPNLSINLLGGIQPEPLRKIANDTVDDGLIQRLLPVILRPASVGKDMPAADVVGEYERLVEQLSLMKPPQRGVIRSDDKQGAVPVRFDDRARAVRERLEHEHLALVEALETVSPKLAAHYGKFDGLFARLCLLWHCIDHADAIHPPPEIGQPTAERVAQFMEQFIRPSAVAFYAGMLGISAGHEELVALAAWIVAKGLNEVGARDAQRSTQSLRHLTADEVRTLCEKLESFGWLDRGEPAPKSNTPRWIVNPRVHDQFGDRAAVEQERREAAREALHDALRP